MVLSFVKSIFNILLSKNLQFSLSNSRKTEAIKKVMSVYCLFENTDDILIENYTMY